MATLQQRPSTPEEVKSIYLQNIGREPTAEELGHHATNKTGITHLQQWAAQAGGKTPTTPSLGGGTSGGLGLNTVLTAMLKDFQGRDVSGLYEQQQKLLKAKYQRAGAITPESMRTMSPSQQSAMRQGSVSALQPEVEAVSLAIKKQEAKGQDFLQTLSLARSLGNDEVLLQEKKRERALEAVKFAAESGAELDEAQLGEVSSLTGYSPDMLTGYFQKAKELSDYETTMMDLDMARARKGLIDDGGDDKNLKAFNTQLTKEVQNLTKGNYGTEGSREKLIQALQTWARINAPEYVDEIPKMVYGTEGYDAILPDGYEQQISGSGSSNSSLLVDPFE